MTLSITFLNHFTFFIQQILPAHRSKFVQFIVFFTCSKFQKYAVLFARRMAEIFLDVQNSHLVRQCACMYLASYCARGNFIPVNVVSDVLVALISWAESYVISSRADCTAALTFENQDHPEPNSFQNIYFLDNKSDVASTAGTCTTASSSSTIVFLQKGFACFFAFFIDFVFVFLNSKRLD